MKNTRQALQRVIAASLFALFASPGIADQAHSRPGDGVRPATSAAHAPWAFITNAQSTFVSLLDTATNTVVGTPFAGPGTWGVSVNWSATRVYMTSFNTNTVKVLNTATNTVVTTIPVGSLPRGVAVNPAETRAYVANLGGNSVSVIDTASNTVTATVPVGSAPLGVAIHPSGTPVYVTNVSSKTVSVINASTNTVDATIVLTGAPEGIAVHPAGTFAYVANETASVHYLTVIDTTTNAIVTNVPVGLDPFGVALNSTGTRVYVANGNSNSVSVINTATNSVVATVPVGTSPAGISLEPNDAFAYVTNSVSNDVSVIDTATNTVVATVNVGITPIAMGNFIGTPPLVNPDAPTSVTATPGNAQATVSFTAPAFEGTSPITSYTVSCMPGLITATGPASPLTVTGLTNGTSYSCTVSASNSSGIGTPSAPAGVTPRTVPAQPTNVTATAGNASASVSFTVPDDGGSPILSFTVVSSPGGFSASGTASPITVAGLTNGTDYTFTVTATNVAGTGAASAASSSVTPHAPGVAAKPSDFNADGKSDILYRNTASGQVYRMLMNGFTITEGAIVYSEPNTAWSIIADGDSNHDGVADLLWRNSSTGQLYQMLVNASGMPNGGAVIYTEPNAAWRLILTPDLNGDGNADLLWWNFVTGQVYGMLQNGTSTIGQGFIYTEPNTDWKIVAAGDFAGSGKHNQLVYRNATTGQVYLMTVTFTANAFSQTGVMIYQEPNQDWRIIGAPDLDGDGKSDLLWRNVTTGQVYGMLMNGTTIATQGMIYVEPNTAWKVVAWGDYNGDGNADLLWRNDSTGQVYMMIMNGLAIAQQAMVYQEANTTWKIVGPWEYALSTGILSGPTDAGAEIKSTLVGAPLNAGRITGEPLNASPGLWGEPVNRDMRMNRY